MYVFFQAPDRVFSNEYRKITMDSVKAEPPQTRAFALAGWAGYRYL